MKVPTIVLAVRSAALKTATSTVAFVFSDDSARPTMGVSPATLAHASTAIAPYAKQRGFSGKLQDVLYVPKGRGLCILIGLGKRDNCTAEQIRLASATAVRVLEKLRVSDAVVTWPERLPRTLKETDVVLASTEGAILGAYEFDRYKSDAGKKFSIKTVTLTVKSVSRAVQQALEEAKLVADAVNQTRDLQNDNSDDVNPEAIEQRARDLAKEYKLRCTVLSGDELKAKGLNLIHAVGRASQWPPRLIMLEYRGERARKEAVAVIGKGITFDTGGVNLKPAHGGMLSEMHLDMSGASVALALIGLAARLQLKTNLIAVLAVAENAIGGNSYKPGSVIKAYNGTTVEVDNTDAEGRLVLADANSYVARHLKPSAIINVATLSGVTLVTFGEHYAGLVSNHDQLSDQLYSSSLRTAEWIWPLPLTDFYRGEIKSGKADVANVPPGRRPYGDTIQAGAFLERFAGETPLAFIDICGSSMRTRASGYQAAGGTGFGVRLLLDFIRRNPRGPKKTGAGSRGLGRYAK